MNSDEEYWNYLHTYGSEDEIREGCEYFDVSPSAFEEDYNSFYDLDKE